MKPWHGKLLRFLGTIVLWGSALTSLVLDLGIAHQELGILGIACGLMLAPVTIVGMPWYGGFAYDDWRPLIIGYVGILVGFLLKRLAKRILHEDKG
jgi:hypothetical protein